jgi:tetratricopeptide (TPR) repeat protein
MTEETGSNRGGRFVAGIEPWLLGGAMFAVYLSTLYHYATPANLGRLAEVSGWSWAPKFFAPITCLVIFPIHWLPDQWKLAGLNVFAAGCAALTLALLARSVALLPHDRTNEQRLREFSESSTLSIRSAWLPPLLAVLVCGLQCSFWERAVEFRDESYIDSGEIFNLLLFAYLIRCLLEYRVSRRESWLTRFALVYGLGLANNWAMIAFFPCFLVAVIWIKGFDFFDWRFMLRMFLCGLASASLFFALPLLDSFQHYAQGGFFDYLSQVVKADYDALRHLPPDRKVTLVIFALTFALPLLMMSIRWGSSFGDNSPMGVALATFGFNVLHIFFLICGLWVCLDPPFSPRRLVYGAIPYLTLYYIGALCVGYFSGYLLLVFGVRPARSSQRKRRSSPWVGAIVVACVWVLAVLTPVILIARNLPQLRAGQAIAAAYDRYFWRTAQSLPQQSSVLLADSGEEPMIYFLEASLVRHRSGRRDMPIDTFLLANSWDYVSHLDNQYPEMGLSVLLAKRSGTKPADMDCVDLLDRLSANHQVFYLHPSFGYYFERFYPESHGLVYRLAVCPTNSWSLPPVQPGLLEENRAFWRDCRADMEIVAKAMREPADAHQPEALQQFEKLAHLPAESNTFAVYLGRFYSRALNCWTVEMVRSASPTNVAAWKEAHDWFDLAEQLNPDNGPARVNSEFSLDRQDGKPSVFKPFSDFEDKLGNYSAFYQTVNNGGPFDEPNFCLVFGLMLFRGHNYRQALEQFNRQHELMPYDPRGLMQTADSLLYIVNHPGAMDYAYPSPLRTFMTAAQTADEAEHLEPQNTNALYLNAMAHFQLGLYAQMHTNAAAEEGPCVWSQAYSNSLTSLAHLLQIVTNEPSALYLQSMSFMQLSNYGAAIAPLTALLAQTNDAMAYLNRAICHLQTEKYDAAREDYEQVIKLRPRAFQADYGLAQIAYRKKDYPAAIQYYESYESNVPPNWRNLPEFKEVDAKLKELKSAPN